MGIVRRTASGGILVATFMLVSNTAGSAMQRNGGSNPVQLSSPDYSASRPTSTSLGLAPDLGDSNSRHELEAKRGVQLNVERQKAMLREAGQLVLMTADLQASLAKDPQGPAREEALRRIDTIEKLARNVKDRMKGGR